MGLFPKQITGFFPLIYILILNYYLFGGQKMPEERRPVDSSFIRLWLIQRSWGCFWWAWRQSWIIWDIYGIFTIFRSFWSKLRDIILSFIVINLGILVFEMRFILKNRVNKALFPPRLRKVLRIIKALTINTYKLSSCIFDSYTVL